VTQTLLLVFARSAGLMFRAPGFTHPSVPTIVRLGLALALALGIAPAVRPHAELDLSAVRRLVEKINRDSRIVDDGAGVHGEENLHVRGLIGV